MATQPPHDDQSKKTDAAGKRPEQFKSPKTPRPEETKGGPRTPKPTLPNMSLDDSEDIFEAAEVIDEAEPIEEAAPLSDEAAQVLADDFPAAGSGVKKAPTPTPASDVFLGEDVEEVVEEAEPFEEAAEVLDEDEMPLAAAATSKHPAPPPSSEPDLNALFGEASAVKEAEPVPAAVEEAEEIAEAMPPSAVEEAEEIAEAMPLSAVEEAEEIAEAMPPSAVEEAEEIAEAMPPSAVEEAEPFSEEADIAGAAGTGSSLVLGESRPPVTEPSEILSGLDLAAAPPASGGKPVEHVFSEETAAAAEEPVHASDVVSAGEEPASASASEVVASHEPIEHGPPLEAPSHIVAAQEPYEHVMETPVSAREPMPSSDVFAAEEAEPMEAASAVESGVEAASAVEAEEVFGADEAEAVPASAVESGEFAEEFAEAVEASSATRKAEGVLDQTVAFEGPSSSKARQADSDVLVTEEEMVGASEASAVDLGEMSKKGSSVTGIDKVAEALESGTDLGDAKASSVEFDELLDDSEDVAAAALDDGSTEMDAGVISEEAKSNGKKKKDKGKGKKDKAAVKSTGDDIDLNDVFGEDAAEGEAVDAEAAEDAAAAVFDDDEAEGVEAEAADAEAADVFKEEAESAEAEATDDDELADFGEDEEPKAKKGKKGHKKDEDEEEEETKSKKKKGKKEKATAAPAAKGGGGILAWVGGMFIAGFLVVGGFVAALFVAPDTIRGVVDMTAGEQKRPVNPKDGGGGGGGAKKEKIDEARGALASGDFKSVFATLQGASDPAELAVLGEARWLEYLGQQDAKKEAPDKDAPAVKQALADLQKSSNKLLAKQIETQLAASSKEKDLSEQLNNVTMEKVAAEKQLTTALAAKMTADKAMDSVADVLVNSKLIADKSKFNAATLDKVVKGLSNDKAAFDKINAILDKQVNKTGEAGLLELLAARDQADKNLAAINKALEGANVKDKDVKGVQELAASRDGLQTEIKGLDAILAQAVKELAAGNILPANADPRKELVQGAKTARIKAESPLSIPLAQLGMSLGGIGSGASKLVEDAFGVAKTATELKWYQAREKLIQTPQQKLDTNIALLQDRTRNDPAELNSIVNEADWILNPESKSDAEARAKALYVKALALRNQEKFAEAKTNVAAALKATPENAKGWKDLVTRSHQELTDSSAYYLPRVERLATEENYPAALAEINSALKALPGDGRLFVRRGLIRLDAARKKGGKLDDDAVNAVRADAASAAKDERASADSAFLLGRLEEDTGKLDAAEKQYRMALKLSEDAKGAEDEAGRYRVALGRLLLRDRTEAAKPVEIEKKKDAKDADGNKLNSNSSPADPQANGNNERGQFVSVVPMPVNLEAEAVSFQPDDDDKELQARLQLVIDEAEKLKASKNPKLQGQGYCLMGSALSKMGKRTEGLKEYAKGLQLLYPGIETQEIRDLIDSHPAFQQPDSFGVANPIMAERYFGEGSHLFWKAMSNPSANSAMQDFKDAEAQFQQAIRHYDKDARYQYYLGFAQLQQKKRGFAIVAFEKGAQLESAAVQSNPFASREINQSLERIQGSMRELLNHYRYRPATEPEAKTKDKEVE